MVQRLYTKNFKSFPAKLKAWQWFSRFSILFNFFFQGLDIVILLGAEGPQQGPQGPRGSEGPPALRRS